VADRRSIAPSLAGDLIQFETSDLEPELSAEE
jgi:hypothetical protein